MYAFLYVIIYYSFNCVSISLVANLGKKINNVDIKMYLKLYNTNKLNI